MAMASPLAAQGGPVPALPPVAAKVPAPIAAPPAPALSPPVEAVLAAGTPVFVMLDQDLTTATSIVGERFQVTVLHDVLDGTMVVIPQGAIGHGEITFVSRRGGFGKAGIISIALRDLVLGNRTVALDGHYREEGKNRSGATAATFFAAGLFAGFIQGDQGGIPKGRELKARTGEAIAYVQSAASSPLPVKIAVPALPAGDAPPVTAGPAVSANNSTRLSRAEPVPQRAIHTTGKQK
jgi:hypothetical protein